MFNVGGRRNPTQGGVGGRRGLGGGLKMRLLIALGIAAFALISYYGNPGDENKVTGDMERVQFDEEVEEMRLGVQAKPQMVQQHGGKSRDRAAQQRVTEVGFELLQALQDDLRGKEGRSIPDGYDFSFTLLADPKTVNAFALPGGPIFITEALYRQLNDRSNGELAGVLGHEVGHVIERHGNKRMAKQRLFSGLATAGGVAGGDANSQRMAQMAAQMVSMKYGREDELESDYWGVKLLLMAGYDPRSMIGVMQVLDKAGGGGGPPEMLSTHPKPANRIEYIQRVIAQVVSEEYNGQLPPNLRP